MARSAAKKTATTKQPSSAVADYQPQEREWDRATELVKLFVATGWLANARSQSLMLNSDPGSGKTELLDRFRGNTQLTHASDLTVRGLYMILRKAQKRAVTHIVATEFQKFLMRKMSTAENMIGTLTQALEEGVNETYVGDKLEDFSGARIGLIGAITGDTLAKRRDMLREIGFLSRVCIIKWRMPDDEIRAVMARMGRGDASDLSLVTLNAPEKPITVDLKVDQSDWFEKYVWREFRDHTVLRVFQRFRALAMASAVLEGRDVVTNWDVQRVYSFHPYWKIMERG